MNWINIGRNDSSLKHYLRSFNRNILSSPQEMGQGGRGWHLSFYGQSLLANLPKATTYDDDWELCCAECSPICCSYCLQLRSCSHLYVFRVRGTGIYWWERTCLMPESKCCLCSCLSVFTYYSMLPHFAGHNHSLGWNLARRPWLTLPPHFLC